MTDSRRVQDDALYVASVVAVPEEYFSDEDDTCLQAAKFVCSRLERQLLLAGHHVENWIKGGCAEDWGVYYESTYQDEAFQYRIIFFPDERRAEQRLVAVQFHRKRPKTGFLKWLFSKPAPLRTAESLQPLMEALGKEFDEYRMLTSKEFDHEYLGA